MLELTLLFGLVAFFFLALYLKFKGDQSKRDEQASLSGGLPTPFIERSLRLVFGFFAVMALLIAFYFTMLGEPTISETVNYTYQNISLLVGPNASTMFFRVNVTPINTTNLTNPDGSAVGFENGSLFFSGNTFVASSLICTAANGYCNGTGAGNSPDNFSWLNEEYAQNASFANYSYVLSLTGVVNGHTSELANRVENSTDLAAWKENNRTHANQSEVNNLQTVKANVTDLTAINATIASISSADKVVNVTYAQDLQAINASINLKANQTQANSIQSSMANTTDLSRINITQGFYLDNASNTANLQRINLTQGFYRDNASQIIIDSGQNATLDARTTDFIANFSNKTDLAAVNATIAAISSADKVVNVTYAQQYADTLANMSNKTDFAPVNASITTLFSNLLGNWTAQLTIATNLLGNWTAQLAGFASNSTAIFNRIDNATFGVWANYWNSTKANQSEVNDLQTAKVNTTEIAAVNASINLKANQTQANSIQSAMANTTDLARINITQGFYLDNASFAIWAAYWNASKANQSQVNSIQSSMANTTDLSRINITQGFYLDNASFAIWAAYWNASKANQTQVNSIQSNMANTTDLSRINITQGFYLDNASFTIWAAYWNASKANQTQANSIQSSMANTTDLSRINITQGFYLDNASFSVWAAYWNSSKANQSQVNSIQSNMANVSDLTRINLTIGNYLDNSTFAVWANYWNSSKANQTLVTQILASMANTTDITQVNASLLNNWTRFLAEATENNRTDLGNWTRFLSEATEVNRTNLGNWTRFISEATETNRTTLGNWTRFIAEASEANRTALNNWTHQLGLNITTLGNWTAQLTGFQTNSTAIFNRVDNATAAGYRLNITAINATNLTSSNGAVAGFANNNHSVYANTSTEKLKINSSAYYSACFNNTIAASVTIDWQNSNKQQIVLSSAPVTLTFVPPAGAASLQLVVYQDATGSRTITWPSGANQMKWAGGAAPTLTTTAGGIDIISFLYNGTTYFGVGTMNFA